MATGISNSSNKPLAPLPPTAAPSAPILDTSKKEPEEVYDPHTKYPNTSIYIIIILLIK
jgi:hypothetical protein